MRVEVLSRNEEEEEPEKTRNEGGKVKKNLKGEGKLFTKMRNFLIDEKENQKGGTADTTKSKKMHEGRTGCHRVLTVS